MNTFRRQIMPLTLALAVAVTLTACQTGPYPAVKHGVGLEETESLVLLDRDLQKAISVDFQRARYTPDGRLIAEANIRNRLSANLNVQLQTVFKDSANVSSGDETTWQTLLLSPHATQTYAAAAMNTSSEKYTIRVRFER